MRTMHDTNVDNGLVFGQRPMTFEHTIPYQLHGGNYPLTCFDRE
ncbi:MAG: hypothetical protein AAGA88_00690 [Pseudomonadota bacterium]